MANRIDSLLAGLGEPEAVVNAWEHEFTIDGLDAARFQDFRNAFEAVMCNEATKRASLAFVAAFLNNNLYETGRLWKAMPNGRLDVDYISNDGDKKVMASLLAGN